MKVGDLAPNFELKSHTGEMIELSSYLGKKKVILFFYVKDNTPGCTAEVKGFKDHYQDISEKYELIGINRFRGITQEILRTKSDTVQTIV